MNLYTDELQGKEMDDKLENFWLETLTFRAKNIILDVALLLYLLEVRLSYRTIQVLVVLINMLGSVSSITDPLVSFHDDFSAYVN